MLVTASLKGSDAHTCPDCLNVSNCASCIARRLARSSCILHSFHFPATMYAPTGGSNRGLESSPLRHMATDLGYDVLAVLTNRLATTVCFSSTTTTRQLPSWRRYSDTKVPRFLGKSSMITAQVSCCQDTYGDRQYLWGSNVHVDVWKKGLSVRSQRTQTQIDGKRSPWHKR